MKDQDKESTPTGHIISRKKRGQSGETLLEDEREHETLQASHS